VTLGQGLANERGAALLAGCASLGFGFKWRQHAVSMETPL